MRVPLTTINQLFSYLSQRQDSNLTKSLPLPQLYLHILFIILIFVVRNKNIFIHFKIDNNMVNLYKLTNLLESGMTIFQLNQWKNEGIWYPITQYKKESNEIEVVTNVFTPLSEENPRFHIQLSANYDTEKAEWNQFLEDYQDNFDEEEHSEIIDYYIDFLEQPETLYQGAEQTINLFKSFIK